MTTSWNAGDTVEFDINGTVSRDRDRGSVGCKTFPLSLLLRHADSVSVQNGRFQAVGVKPPAEFVGSDYVNILHDEGSVRFTARELDGYATTVRVTARGPVDPATLPWQDGDAILVHTGQMGTDGGGRRKAPGVYVLNNTRDRDHTAGDFLHPSSGDRIGLYGVDHCVRRTGPVSGDFSDIALKDFTVLVRGGQVVTQWKSAQQFSDGDRVRLRQNIGGRQGVAGQTGTLRTTTTGRVSFVPDGDGEAGVGGGYGRGHYSIGDRGYGKRWTDPDLQDHLAQWVEHI